jgi:hypothetical protein
LAEEAALQGKVLLQNLDPLEVEEEPGRGVRSKYAGIPQGVCPPALSGVGVAATSLDAIMVGGQK